MFVNNPLPLFNGKNPFVKMCKDQYVALWDKIHECTKLYMKYLLSSISISVIDSIAVISLTLYKGVTVTTLLFTAFTVVYILQYLINNVIFDKSLKRIIAFNFELSEVEKLSTMTYDEAVSANNVDLINASIDINRALGETDKYYEILTMHINFINTACLAISIVLIVFSII